MKKTIAFCFIWIGIFFCFSAAANLVSISSFRMARTSLTLIFILSFMITQRFFSEDQL